MQPTSRKEFVDKESNTKTKAQPCPDAYLVKREIAARLRKEPRTIERWMRQGILPHRKIGTGRRATVLFSWSEVEAALKSRFGRGLVQ